MPRAAFDLHTERSHELVEILAAEELVTFPEELARHGDRPDETRGERGEREIKRSAATGRSSIQPGDHWTTSWSIGAVMRTEQGMPG